MTETELRLEEGVSRLVDEYRTRCLWFLRPGYYPSGGAEQLRVLEQIEKHGDREAFQRAGELRKWLSQSSSAGAAAS